MLNKFNDEGLLGPQKNHAKSLLDSLYLNGVADDLSECGCGKTYVACAIARAYNRPVVIICPKTIIRKWETTMAVYGVKPHTVINYEKLVRGGTKWLKYDPQPSGLRFELPRMFLTHLYFPENALIILDEAHRCKAMNSLQAGIMIACKRQGYKLLNLSASAATSPLEMRAFGYANNLTRTTANKEFKEWAVDHGAEWVGRWGALTFDKDQDKSRKMMTAIHRNLFDVQKVASRLTRKMMGSHFPDNHIVAEAVSMGQVATKRINAIYDHLEEAIAKLNERTENYGDCILSLILEARQKVELAKVPAFVEMIEDMYEEGNSVVCFINFTATIHAIAKALNHRKEFQGNIGYIFGEQTDKQREKDINDFQADRKRIILANQAAGGVAIDLHDLNGVYPRTSILSPTFSAIQLLQALGRIHRMEGKTPAYQVLMFARDTIEEKAMHKTQGKLDRLDLLNDGDLSMGFNLFRK